MEKKHVLIIGGLFFLALLIRLILLPNRGFEADISFWKSWGLAVYDGGIVWAAKNTNNNYPTPFAYTLGFLVWVYSFFSNPHTFNEFWSNNNLLFLTIAKLPAVLSDFGIAAIIFWIGKHAKRLNFPSLPLIVYACFALFFLLSPVSIIDSAWWGQVDSLGLFIFLLACCFVLTKRPLVAGIIFMLAMMTKLQNMIYGPIFFLFIWQTLGFDGLIKALAGSALAFFGLNIEFFTNHEMKKVVDSLTSNYDYFPWMSLNAFNLWWIVSGAKGMQVSDKLLAVGVANAKTVGLMLFSSVYLFAVLRQLTKPNPISPWLHGSMAKNNNVPIQPRSPQTINQIFLENLILVNAAFFLFQTQSHDRYAFPLAAFLLLWAPWFITSVRGSEQNKFRIYSLFYILYTVFYFYNLHTALVFNYPLNGLPFLSNIIQSPVTMITSIIHILLFFIFLCYTVKRNDKIAFLMPVVLLVIALSLPNLPLLTKKPVLLTQLKPWVSQQGYGERMTDMPVDAYLGFSKWSPLSVQYAFYRHGIGTHANSVMNYDIGGYFKRFTTDYGIDTEAGNKGTAVFSIYGDGRLLFKSGKIGRFDMPRHADVDVSGVKNLGIVTTDAGDGINDDHTDWLNPLLYP